jgi:hypothetical protein
VDTDDLKPKSEAECADLGLKVCGYKCMPAGDPATGCAEPGCAPCPAAAAGGIVYCDPDLRCAAKPACPAGQDYCEGEWDTVCDDFQTSAAHCGGCGNACSTSCVAGRCACPAGQAYCDGPVDTVCDDLQASATNCGACGHGCASSATSATCTAGTCVPAVAAVPGRPLDIDTDSSELFWIAEDPIFAGSGGLHRLADVAGGNTAPWVGGLGAVDRLAVGAAEIFVSQGTSRGTVWKIAAGAASAHYTPGGVVRAMALDREYLYLTETGPTPTLLMNVPRGAGTIYAHDFVGAGGLAGVATLDPAGTGRIVVGTETGALKWVSYDLTTEGTYATGIDPPVQVAVYRGEVGRDGVPHEVAFWITRGGNVYAQDLPDGSVIPFTTWPEIGSPPARMDVFADARGMVWSDARNGVVAEWRAARDDVLLLAAGQSPGGVTATQDLVIWTDTLAGELRWVAR